MRRILSTLSILIGLVVLVLTTYPLPSQTSEWSSLPPQAFRYTLKWPTAVRFGEPRTVILTIHSAAAFPSGTVFNSRLEFASLQTTPAGTLALPAGNTTDLTFRWKVLPTVQGGQKGALWLYSSVPGGDSPQLLFSRPLDIRIIHLGRIPFLLIRWASVGIILFGIFQILHRPNYKKNRP